MSRKRFNPNRLCSSENYGISCKIHREFIQRFHNEHIAEIHEISTQIKVHKKYFVQCFGKLIEVSEVEVKELEQFAKIIVK